MEHEHEKPITFFRFEDLRIYHKALEYIDWVYIMARGSEKDHIMQTFFDKYVASAQAIALYIAEGSSRNKSQFIYYLKISKSSVRECVVISTIAQRRSYLSKGAYDDSKNQLMEMTKMIGALIGSLQRSVKPDELDEEDGLD
jgi:four helix bundle protein